MLLGVVSLMDRPLVYRCLLGMADAKPQRRRLHNSNNIRNNRLLHHQGSRVLHHNSWCSSCYTEYPKSKTLPWATSPESRSTTPRPRITTTLKRSSITLQPTLPRATTPTSQSITVRKKSLLKKKKSSTNCRALSVTNCIPHRETDSQLWVNILIFIQSLVSIFFFCFLLCLSIFNNIKIYLLFCLFSQLWCRAPVGCCIADGWVDHWCTDLYLVWRKPNRNAAAFLHNLRND